VRRASPSTPRRRNIAPPSIISVSAISPTAEAAVAGPALGRAAQHINDDVLETFVTIGTYDTIAASCWIASARSSPLRVLDRGQERRRPRTSCAVSQKTSI
jgi:hypothetical protein